MVTPQVGSQVIALTEEISESGGVFFDPDKVCLEGTYRDQISTYRAKRSWIGTLERCFLLDPSCDFNIVVTSDLEKGLFHLRCDFTSACARYAFWRLTNDQAPEAQYLIETGHVPFAVSQSSDFISAPDLRRSESGDEPLVLGTNYAPEGIRSTLIKWVEKLINRLQ